MNEEVIRVLLVDDDAAIRRALRTALNELGFETIEASRGEEALQLALTRSIDVILLDSTMPGLGGKKTLVRLRAAHPRLPILMLTVKDEEKDKVEALESGADDYMTKPFGMRECVARIRAAVRRTRTPETPEDAPLTIGDIRAVPARRVVCKGGEPIHLTPKEYDMLFYLMRHAGRVVTYGDLLRSVWGVSYRQEVDYLRTFMRQLRKKIEDDPSNPRYLLTDPYIGYRFAEFPSEERAEDSAGQVFFTNE